MVIKNFPAHLVDRARELLAKEVARLARAAARSGQVAPEIPELVIVAEYTAVKCSKCPSRGGVAGMACKDSLCPGVYVERNCVDIELVCDRPALAGWELLAVIEPLDGGNLIRKVPGAEEISFDAWRNSNLVCDHCHKARRRNETFLVRATGEDSNIAAGTIRQVGRNCLADFLGGQSPTAIISRLAWPQIVENLGESGGGGNYMDLSCDPLAYLVWVAAVIRVDGWTSRAQARNEDKPSTSDDASYLMDPPGDSFQAREAWRRAREKYAPSDKDHETAKAALAWAQNLEGNSEYELNLRLVARQERTSPKHRGILASAISAYERAMGRRAAAHKARAASTHQGEVGKRVELALTVERVTDVDSQYGTVHIHVMRDLDGNVYVWKTGSKRIAPGTECKGKCTIKAHTEYNGVAQTELSRCSF